MTDNGAVAMPPHLRRTLAGLDGLSARAEAAMARWVANGWVVAGDRRSVALASLADVRLERLRVSRTAVLAGGGRRRGAASCLLSRTALCPKTDGTLPGPGRLWLRIPPTFRC